jgi:hypothetical protein
MGKKATIFLLLGVIFILIAFFMLTKPDIHHLSFLTKGAKNNDVTRTVPFKVDDDVAHEKTILLPTDLPIPEIRFDMVEDELGGLNINISTTNFVFTPENVDGEHVPGEGHAHLYIDGSKVARVYGKWFYIPPLDPGTYTIRMTLNANTHETYITGGGSIEAIREVVVHEKESSEQAGGYDY